MNENIFFMVINKDHRLYGEIGKLKQRLEGIPALYVLEFKTGEIRGFKASELRPNEYA
jgi:hypothetical protein